MITVSLETAKKLKEAGRNKETLFSYWDDRKPHKAYNCPVVCKYETREFIPFRNLDDTSIKQEWFDWATIYSPEWLVFGVTSEVNNTNMYWNWIDWITLSSPTAQELLDVLPYTIDDGFNLEIVKYKDNMYQAAYLRNHKEFIYEWWYVKSTLAEALASLVLRSEKNGYLSF